MSWTDERIDRLKELWSKGMTASQIADELGGVSRNAVIGKAHRLGASVATFTSQAERSDRNQGQDQGEEQGRPGRGGSRGGRACRRAAQGASASGEGNA